MDEDDLDLEARRLCPDGACIGVVGGDGRCKVCGRVDEGAPYRDRELALEQDPPAPPPPSPKKKDKSKDKPQAKEKSDAPAEWDDRELCPDGACIGVIGSDGKCRECGRARASA